MSHLSTLKAYQAWRRGAETEMIPPAVIGEAIDYAIAVCEAAENLVKVKGRHHSEEAYKRLTDAVDGIPPK